MNNYSTKQTSLTIGSSITIAGILAYQCFAPNAYLPETQQLRIEDINEKRDYQVVNTPSTFFKLKNPLTGNYQFETVANFESAISDFYVSLLNNQISLGTEFEKVLYDNLWDLYES